MLKLWSRKWPSPDNTDLEEIFRFSIDSSVCLESSGHLDFAIFEVAVPQNVKLVWDSHNSGTYSMISGEISGWQGNTIVISLSAPCVARSGVVCTHDGFAVGYVGGVLDDESAEGEKYELYAYPLHRMPLHLPRYLPSEDDDENEDEEEED
ncbi:hypothetical protein PHYSODRAFT_307188 [Phytophthora sojae]|uniref:Uncharacterized protein n=1 Tax=Phytophthora sojae (strain P6497) TaxID=1094619 RepID=G5AD98_PHYSP|nr:hypothetical protein PHYSODRAFT_307188 [Phytophthora sojae]EGZ06151.1 hypothetical protein PHYSODRAFT_307188 [Phytophthora sojae]|eukprot:XP_009538048.1 hypothetical protein PHYSODRAFT_307188 [Phytophthora sojae]